MHGVFAINKPKGPTSNKILQDIKGLTGAKKVGHAGTLDPLASGVLIVGVGNGTKELTKIVKDEKEYIADIILGVKSSTDDEEGIKTIVDKTIQDISTVKMVLKEFVGRIQQVPPIFSAIKIKGREAYKLARAGETPEMKARQVDIKNIELIDYEWPDMKIKVTTGPGVYIRSLARDIGERLKTGGYLHDLKRTRVGIFKIEDAVLPEEFKKT